jgi:hypothetical protein
MLSRPALRQPRLAHSLFALGIIVLNLIELVWPNRLTLSAYTHSICSLITYLTLLTRMILLKKLRVRPLVSTLRPTLVVRTRAY